VLPEPRIITERFLAMVDQLETRLVAEDPERARPALIDAIGDRIVLKPDVSGRFLWAEYGLQGELLASLGRVPCPSWCGGSLRQLSKRRSRVTLVAHPRPRGPDAVVGSNIKPVRNRSTWPPTC